MNEDKLDLLIERQAGMDMEMRHLRATQEAMDRCMMSMEAMLLRIVTAPRVYVSPEEKAAPEVDPTPRR